MREGCGRFKAGTAFKHMEPLTTCDRNCLISAHFLLVPRELICSLSNVSFCRFFFFLRVTRRHQFCVLIQSICAGTKDFWSARARAGNKRRTTGCGYENKTHFYILKWCDRCTRSLVSGTGATMDGSSQRLRVLIYIYHLSREKYRCQICSFIRAARV